MENFVAHLTSVSLPSVLKAVLLFIILVIAMRVINGIVAKMLGKSKLEKTLHGFIKGAVKVVLLFVATMILCGALGIDTSSLLAVFGMLGLAISLSVQDSLSNIVNGIMILATKPFKVGDYVNVAGQDGVVNKVGLLHTVVYTLDNQCIHVPNSQVTANKIVNCTGVDKRRVDLVFTASYDCDVEAVKAALVEAGQHEYRLPEEPVFARVSNYGSSIEYTVRIWTTPEHYWDVYFDTIENVKKVYDAKGLAMSYPHVNVHMIDDKQ